MTRDKSNPRSRGAVPADAVVPLNSFAEVQNFITQVLTQNGEASGVTTSPHGSFWTTLSYRDFVTGDVPHVTDPNSGQPIPILSRETPPTPTSFSPCKGKGLCLIRR